MELTVIILIGIALVSISYSFLVVRRVKKQIFEMSETLEM